MVYLKEEHFGTFLKTSVKKFTWTTDSGFSVSVITYGAIVTNIWVPDKNNEIKDVALGFEDLKGYIKHYTPDRFGCVVGRCMGRVANGKFQIDGQHFQLSQNQESRDHLHGGFVAFDKVNWHPTVRGSSVTLSYLSQDGEEGYPGDLITNITYIVTDYGALTIDYAAMTNKKTIVNLSNHSYFNLAGHETGCKQLYEHNVTLNCDKILEGDKDWIPTGRLLPVGDTAFDLRSPRRLGDVIDEPEIRFHHNWAVASHGHQGINFVARAIHAHSGRYMEVYSDQPGLLFYTGYFLPSREDTPLPGKGGAEYRRHAGFCMETQNFVDAINHPNFPSPILSPGEVYRHTVRYVFGAVRKRGSSN